MNTFQYLKEDEQHIQNSLQILIENYRNWTQEQLLERAKEVFNSIQEHIIKKDKILFANLPNRSSISYLFDKWVESKASINNVIEDLVVIHVDEPDFEILLLHLSKVFNNLVHFSQEELYPAIRHAATNTDIKRINSQLDAMILS